MSSRPVDPEPDPSAEGHVVPFALVDRSLRGALTPEFGNASWPALRETIYHLRSLSIRSLAADE